MNITRLDPTKKIVPGERSNLATSGEGEKGWGGEDSHSQWGRFSSG